MSFIARLDRFKAAMAAKLHEGSPVQVAVLSVPQNIGWLSGLNTIIHSKPVFLIVVEGDDVLLAPAIREDIAKEQSMIKDIRLYGHWTGRVSYADTWYEGVAMVLAERGLTDKVIGYEDKIGIYTVDPKELREKLPKAKLVGITEEIATCRMIKDPDEIANGRIAAAITVAGKYAYLFGLARGKSELGAGNDAEDAMRRLHERDYPDVVQSDYGSFEGGKHCGFECWSMSGPRKFLNTARSTKRVPRKGETGSLLLWAVAYGIHAELEITYRMGDAPEVEMKAMRDALDVDSACLKRFMPGAVLEDVYHFGIEMARERNYEAFPARIGHTIGHGNHESVSIAPGSKVVMQPGMMITIEYHVQLLPNIAATQFSITVVITEDGFDFITPFPNLDELDVLAMRPDWWLLPLSWLPVCLMNRACVQN